MTTVRQPTSAARVLPPVLVGAVVAVALGVYGRVHHPTLKAFWTGPFPSMFSMKVWLTVIVLALALVQLVTALWMYGKLGVRAPGWTGRLHKTTGTLAFLVSLPVAAHCLWALGFQADDARVIAHGLLGCA